MQSHPLRRTRLGQYQASSADVSQLIDYDQSRFSVKYKQLSNWGWTQQAIRSTDRKRCCRRVGGELQETVVSVCSKTTTVHMCKSPVCIHHCNTHTHTHNKDFCLTSATPAIATPAIATPAIATLVIATPVIANPAIASPLIATPVIALVTTGVNSG